LELEAGRQYAAVTADLRALWRSAESVPPWIELEPAKSAWHPLIIVIAAAALLATALVFLSLPAFALDVAASSIIPATDENAT